MPNFESEVRTVIRELCWGECRSCECRPRVFTGQMRNGLKEIWKPKEKRSKRSGKFLSSLSCCLGVRFITGTGSQWSQHPSVQCPRLAVLSLEQWAGPEPAPAAPAGW